MPAQQPGKGIGHFLGAMRIDAFRSAQEFKSEMDKWIQGFRNAAPSQAGRSVLIPGDPERLMEKQRVVQGIPLHPLVVKDLELLAVECGVRF